MHLESRSIVSGPVVEFYLSATPDPAADPAGEARRIFADMQAEAARHGARICRQRIFVPDGCEAAYRQAWQAGHVNGQPEIPCNWLRAGPGAPGGVQAYAAAGPGRWIALRDDAGCVAGWALENGPQRWAAIGSRCLPRTADDTAMTRAAFEDAERLLAQAGMGLGDVARTWFFLDDILAWYGPFNAGRNEFFRQRNLLGAGANKGVNVPASTGVGVSPLNGGRLALELVAVAGAEDCVIRHPAAGQQRCAYDYGSAFARAAEAVTPAGRTVFVSGTAAIDAQGRTCFPDDAAGQIRMTIENVLAVLAQLRRPREQVVDAIAYCKTAAIAAEFAKNFQRKQPWPWLVVVCDICRADLLFEVEVTAGPARASKRGQAAGV